jgi:Zn-dependent M32 family carboxypeptidase
MTPASAGHSVKKRNSISELLVVAKIGYDLECGRLDKTHHPFCAKFSVGDVRITPSIRATLSVRSL